MWIYRNLPADVPVSSWLWHYDNCPDPYSKILINLTDVSHDDGPMQYLSGHVSSVPKYLSSRVSPTYTDMSQTMFYHSRIPNSVIDNILEDSCSVRSLTGPPGTYAVFSPNQPHRATSPSCQSTRYRDAVVYVLRPTLDRKNRYNRMIGMAPPPSDAGIYSLD